MLPLSSLGGDGLGAGGSSGAGGGGAGAGAGGSVTGSVTGSGSGAAGSGSGAASGSAGAAAGMSGMGGGVPFSGAAVGSAMPWSMRAPPPPPVHIGQQAFAPQVGVSPTRHVGLKQRTGWTPGPLHVEGAPGHCSTTRPLEL